MTPANFFLDPVSASSGTRAAKAATHTAAVLCGLVAAALAGFSGAALAQYKVVLPDGSTTYTDRPPADTTKAKVTSMNRRGTNLSAEAVDANAGLPLDLRQAAQRYPVTLYTSNDCTNCEAGRRFLQQRGIPYAEKRVSSDEEVVTLERLVGARAVPALTIGAQPLRGFSEADWASYLDAAGYPKESKLPRNWPVATPQPLVERIAAAKPERVDAPALPPEPPPATTGQRF